MPSVWSWASRFAVRRVVLAVGLVAAISIPGSAGSTVGLYEIEGPVSLAWEGWFELPGSGVFRPLNLLTFEGDAPAQGRIFAVAHAWGGTLTTTQQSILGIESATGAELWRKTFEVVPGAGFFYRGVVSRDRQRVSLARSWDASQAIEVLTLDAGTGAELWRRTTAALPSNSSVVFSDVREGANGTVVVTGLYEDRQSPYTVTYHLYAAGFRGSTLGPVWTDVHPTAVDSNLWYGGLGVSLDGVRAFVARGGIDQGLPYLFVVAYDTSTGVRLWEVLHQDADGSGGFPTDVSVSPDGSQVFVLGEVFFDGNPQPRVWAFDAGTGTLDWVADTSLGDDPQNYAHPENLVVSQLVGRVFVSSNDNSGMLIDCFDSETGELQWMTRYPGNEPERGAASNGMAVTPDGEILVVDANVRIPTAMGYWKDERDVIGIHAGSGARVWRAIGSIPLATSTNFPHSFAYEPDGTRVFVSGELAAGDWTDQFPVVAYDTCVPTFTDVTCSDPFWPFIEIVNAAGVAAGFSDGTFRPAQGVTRGQMAVFLARTADLTLGDFAAYQPPACGTKTFTDVSCTNPQYKFIEYIAARGIAAGFPDGTYRPGIGVNRGAMAIFLARTRDVADGDLAAFAPPPCGSESFTDVPCTAGAYRFVEYIRNKGITSGNANGTYGIANGVTRGQMAVFVTRTGNLGK